MRIIPTVSVATLFIPITLYFNEYRSAIITINGILCHTNETIWFFKYNDIIWNTLLIIYSAYHNTDIIKYQILAICIYVCNVWLYEKKLISRNISDIIHVTGVQGIAAYGIFKDCLLHYKI